MKIQGIVVKVLLMFFFSRPLKVLLMLRIIMVTSNAVDVGKVGRYLEKKLDG